MSVHYVNRGTKAVSGTVTLQYDSLTNFQYFNGPSGATHDPLNHSISWTFSNLAPWDYQGPFRATFRLPATVALGTILNATVTLNPTLGDIDISNNTDQCNVVVRGAYDPNDKAVNQPADIQGDEWMQYTIRFQNTGTDTAFNVEVRDVLDPNLDLNTFQMLGASHEYSLHIKANREAIWTFPNILLPDSNINEPLSHGHIIYRIKPTPSLPSGTSISNTAAIYFDFNAPIITNTTVNSIAFPLHFLEPEIEDEEHIAGLSVYPNPVSELLHLSFANDDEITLFIRLSELSGKVLVERSLKGSAASIDVQALSSGVYLLHITNEAGQQSWRKILVK
jgi:uncharacterized repeat protein (TIGR01451 family)